MSDELDGVIGAVIDIETTGWPVAISQPANHP